jgi:NitT/TauT family transport system permease protein
MVLPSPADTLQALADDFITGLIWPHLLTTLIEILIGYSIGCGLALILAALFALSLLAERLLMLLVLAFQALPKIALAPLVFVWCGFGIGSTVTMIAAACFYPVFIHAFVGFRGTDANLLDMYRAFGSRKLNVFWSVQLPSAAGYIFSGLEMSVVFALTAAIVMEMIAGTSGLGYLIQIRSGAFNSAGVFAVLLMLASLGLLAEKTVKAAWKSFVFWDQRASETGGPRYTYSRSIFGSILATATTAAVVLAIWEYATSRYGFPPTILPPPQGVLRALASGLVEGHLWPHIMFTTQAAFAGLWIGGVLGVLLGAAIALAPMVESFVAPAIIGLQSLPKVALAPLITWYLGYGIEPKVFTAALLSFFPIFVASINGLRSLSPELMDLYRATSASPWHVFLNARLPAAAPYLFSALQVSVVLSLTGSVVSEFVASSQGLGYIIKARSQDLDLSMAFAAVVILATLGVCGSLVVQVAQRRLVFWQSS